MGKRDMRNKARNIVKGIKTRKIFSLCAPLPDEFQFTAHDMLYTATRDHPHYIALKSATVKKIKKVCLAKQY